MVKSSVRAHCLQLANWRKFVGHLNMKKEKIIRVRITADVAEKLQQVGNVSAYIRSALIAKMENEKLIKIKIPF